MNSGMIARAVQRHRHMDDRPAYEALLQHAKNHGDVWMASQREFAEWWRARHRATMRLTVDDAGKLQVDTNLQNAVLEIDDELRALPTQVSLASSPSAGPVLVRYQAPGDAGFARDILAHLGYNYIQAAADKPDIPADEFSSALRKLRDSFHKGYDPDDLEVVRSIVRAAVRRRGLPDLRLWTLPHRGGRPYRAALSPRFDVDKAIVNLPAIHKLERPYGARSTIYLRPLGPFYGTREIKRYASGIDDGPELALHGEFITTAEKIFGDETKAAIGEKDRLDQMIDRRVVGVCMHGGELRSNQSAQTLAAIDNAEFLYRTPAYKRPYFLPIFFPHSDGLRPTLTIMRQSDDISAPLGHGFAENLSKLLHEDFDGAVASGGVMVPVFHPLYFDFKHYISRPLNLYRMTTFFPVFVSRALQMKRDQMFSNKPVKTG